MKKVKVMWHAVILLCIGTFADIAFEPVPDLSFIPIHSRFWSAPSTEVQMVSELVTVDLYRSHALVTAEFNMKNCGAETTFEVGFPNIEGLLTDFTVSVDGKNQPFKTHSLGLSEKQPVWNGSFLWDGWFLWNVTFDEAESKKIVVRYQHSPKIDNIVGGILGKCYFWYILETGASWHKEIEQATVVVNLKNGLTSDQILSKKPSNATISKDQLRWDFKNLEPKHDSNVVVEYNRYADYSEYIESHRNDKFDDEDKILKMAYACNKSGEHELAEKILEEHCRQPNDSDRYENARVDRNLNLNKCEQLFMHKLLVMARYQLCLKNQNKENKERLRKALEGLKAWGVLDVDNPEEIVSGFPDGDYGEASTQWILTEYLVDYEIAGHTSSAMRTFIYRWNKKINGLDYNMEEIHSIELDQKGGLVVFTNDVARIEISKADLVGSLEAAIEEHHIGADEDLWTLLENTEGDFFLNEIDPKLQKRAKFRISERLQEGKAQVFDLEKRQYVKSYIVEDWKHYTEKSSEGGKAFLLRDNKNDFFRVREWEGGGRR